MRECRCEAPEPKPNKPSVCVKCGDRFGDWASNSKTLGEFLDRLAATLPVRGDAWMRFRLHVETRELAGRPVFRQSFLARENLREAEEEAADLALYACLDALKARRAAGEDRDLDLALTVAHHAYKAYAGLIELRHKRQGAP